MTPTPPRKIDPLIVKGQQILTEMFTLQERINGINYTPKHLRDDRMEKWVARWNELVEELEKVQNQLPPEKTNDVSNTTPMATDKKRSGRSVSKNKRNN